MVAKIQEFLGGKEAEVLDFQPQAKTQFMNPNPYLMYRDTIGGKRMYFEPFKLYECKKLLGDMLLSRAAENWRNSKRNAKSERQSWAICISSANMVKKDMARDFADENGTPRTRVYPYPGLVPIHTVHGQKAIEAGLKFLEETKGEKLEEYLAHYKDHIWDPEFDKKEKERNKRPVADTEDFLAESEEAVSPIMIPKLEKPDTGWEAEQKVGYIERLADKKVPKNSIEDHDYLNAKMQEAYEAFKARLDKAGVKYQED